MKDLPNYTWKELADEFHVLSTPDESFKVTFKWSDESPIVTIRQGFFEHDNKFAKFKTLCEIAGQKILSIQDEENLGIKEVNSSNDILRWMLVLSKLSDGYIEYPKHMEEHGGKEVEVYSAKIKDPINTSERLCMKLSGYDLPEEPTWFDKFWADHGKQIINVAIGGGIGSVLTWLVLSYFR